MEKIYSIFHASVQILQTEFHTTATQPGLLGNKCFYAPLRAGLNQGPITFIEKRQRLCR